MEEKKCLVTGSDQGAYNWLYYDRPTRIPTDLEIVAMPYRVGAVFTVGAIGSIIREHYGPAPAPFYNGPSREEGQWLDDNWGLIDEQGYFTQLDGTRAAVVHQYDRFGRRFYSPVLD